MTNNYAGWPVIQAFRRLGRKLELANAKGRAAKILIRARHRVAEAEDLAQEFGTDEPLNIPEIQKLREALQRQK